MKILFMGTPDFAEGVLSAIYESRHEVVAVVTQPDRPRGRSQTLIASPVKEFAAKRGIPVLQPERIKSPEEIEKLRAIDADIYVVAAFGQILSKEILDIPGYGCINVHASLLPEYRGAAPIQWAIADGKEQTGVTIQQMNEGVDTGDIIASSVVDISSDETGATLFDKLMNEGAVLAVDTLDLMERGEVRRVPQDESKATYAKMIKKEMGCIDFDTSAVRTQRLVRAFDPWPGVYTYLNGKVLKIKKCCVYDGDLSGEPGEVITVSDDAIVIAFAEGALSVTAVQLEGKKQMPVHDFLLGNPVKTGTKLGMTERKAGER
ncbi:MAG: methionyl-tRNA formyltransferase [Lachnospiraceae bacterium]|nr:methionyl-tRNA formyltransferase [Lachnospiraceae bacterium]